MYCIGLTGNIASGKSTVAQFFVNLDIDVIHADNISKELTQSNTPAYEAIVKHFGKDIVKDNQLDRRKLRQIIIHDANKRLWLEELLHPLIRETIISRVYLARSPYCVIEIPLLTNRKDFLYLDRVLFVKADTELKIARLMARDACSREDAEAILATQLEPEKHYYLADDILVNGADVELLELQVQFLHEKYMKYARVKLTESPQGFNPLASKPFF